MLATGVAGVGEENKLCLRDVHGHPCSAICLHTSL